MTLYDNIEQATGQRPKDISPLTGGAVGEVYRVEMPDQQRLVAKVTTNPEINLAIEGYMLRYLKEHSRLPVPEVIYESGALLLISFIPGSNDYSQAAQVHAAELLADLHSVTASQFGLDQDTLSGLLALPNRWTVSWLDFFREQRLLYVARDCVQRGFMPSGYLARVEKLAERLDDWLDEPPRPALIHGDVWRNNLLAANGQMTAFLDPSIYYAHPEIELTYMTWSKTFEPVFWERYADLRPIAPGFFEVRCKLYTLYPLLVHVWHFSAERQYLEGVDRVLKDFGF